MPKCRHLPPFQASQGFLPSLQLPLGPKGCRYPLHPELHMPALGRCLRYILSARGAWILLLESACVDKEARLCRNLESQQCFGRPEGYSSLWLTLHILIKAAQGSEKSSLSTLSVETRMLMGCWISGENINLELFSSRNAPLTSQDL